MKATLINHSKHVGMKTYGFSIGGGRSMVFNVIHGRVTFYNMHNGAILDRSFPSRYDAATLMKFIRSM
jgi:hypothetical protein